MKTKITGQDVVYNALAHVHHISGESFEVLRSFFVDTIIEQAPVVCNKPYAELNDREFLNLSAAIIRDIIAEINEELGTEYSIMNYSKRKFDYASSILQ